MSAQKIHLITIKQAAEFAACNPKTIRRHIAAGRLGGYRLGTRILRVDLNELEQLLSPIPTTTGTQAATRTN